MLVDYDSGAVIVPTFAKQPKSHFPAPARYSSDRIDLDELCDAVTERLYRCDIAHVWLGNCKVFADVVLPKLGDPDYPYGFEHGLTVHPSDMPGNGRQQYIRYMVKTWIAHDIDGMITNLADDLLFDLHRYGKYDMAGHIEDDCMNMVGIHVILPTRVVNAAEMPAKHKLKWAKSTMAKFIGYSKPAGSTA